MRGKTTVAIIWLELCKISTVSLCVVMFKIQTRYLRGISHTPYHLYHFIHVRICGLRSGIVS